MELCDTHCHLSDPPLAGDVAGVLARARAAGVTRVVAPAYDAASWESLRGLAREQGIPVALGQHPWATHEPLDIERLRDALLACGAVAVGEIGLDSLVDGADLRAQKSALTRQLRLAQDLGLPVILHCRGAFADLIAVLKEHGFGTVAGLEPSAPRGVVHAFARGPELAARFLELGLHLAFGGAVTRPGSRAQRSAKVAPLERLLLETDAPAIGLLDVEPRDVEPRHAREVAMAVAALRGETFERIAEVTTANARALFRI